MFRNRVSQKILSVFFSRRSSLTSSLRQYFTKLEDRENRIFNSIQNNDVDLFPRTRCNFLIVFFASWALAPFSLHLFRLTQLHTDCFSYRTQPFQQKSTQTMTMKTACVLAAASLVASASAFAPTQTARTTTSTSLNEFANGYVGGEGPEPIPFSSQQSSVNWDPAGFTEVGLLRYIY